MDCYLCVLYGTAIIAAIAFILGMGMGAFVMWDILSRAPKIDLRDRTWSYRREASH